VAVVIVVIIIGMGSGTAYGHRRGAAVLGQSLCRLQGNLAIVSIGRKRRLGVAGISINPYFL
jgi:hypothetical protein